MAVPAAHRSSLYGCDTFDAYDDDASDNLILKENGVSGGGDDVAAMAFKSGMAKVQLLLLTFLMPLLLSLLPVVIALWSSFLRAALQPLRQSIVALST